MFLFRNSRIKFAFIPLFVIDIYDSIIDILFSLFSTILNEFILFEYIIFSNFLFSLINFFDLVVILFILFFS